MRFLLACLLLAGSSAAAPSAKIRGLLKLWHPITLSVVGPEVAEDSTPNPFLDYRLTVTFTHSQRGTRHVVPGFFAADGIAAETSATKGNQWQARFTPDRSGTWKYEASLRSGPAIALSTDPAAGQPTPFDGASGEFRIAPADPKAPGFLKQGTLRYTGDHYLQFAGTGTRFLKGGADSPENFLAYFEFDQTLDTDATFNEGKNSTGKAFVHHYEPHAADWKPGDPTWQGDKGKNIIGALNYLASKGMNSVYFLTYNVDTGDGKDTWPWTSPQVRDRYDTSKLDQWEIVFSHMDRLGLMLHVILHETENDRKLGGGPDLNPIRKLYLRELIARFSHHPALVWNLGEENNIPDQDRKEIAAWIRALDPQKHPITVHTHVNKVAAFYNGILGDPNFEATSNQENMDRYNQSAISLRQRSAQAGRKWVIFGDEQPHADSGVLPDSADPNHDIPRTQALWGNLMGGGSGVEWYFGYKYPHMDLNCEDWRSRDRMWDQTRFALQFFQQNLPYWEMTPDNTLADGAYVLAKPGSVYAVYLPNGGAPQLKLDAGQYTVRWYNPRAGGALQTGTAAAVSGPGAVSLGQPPSDPSADWAVLVKRK
jgi:hypothetical protein